MIGKGKGCNIIRSFPFYFDMTGTLKPWLSFSQFEKELWKIAEEELAELKINLKNLSKPEKNKKVIIVIALYIDLLFWSHGKRVNRLGVDLYNDIEQLLYKPYNCGERLKFIIEHVHHFQAVVQLEHLFEEQRKKIAKMKLIEKK
ncbi:YpoC family protein [Bacillus sp. JCM 19034]|uniref:YpoC family protein n=1 Tax=Bacillus sp. JCM 19034 TaxID=1481928 RepID=UPI00078535AB|nr:hypothetical protein [Bacillus sp. JCM 19034]